MIKRAFEGLRGSDRFTAFKVLQVSHELLQQSLRLPAILINALRHLAHLAK